MKYFIGVFSILHGLVHLLYMGHSLNYFELEKGFIWPDNSKFLCNISSLQAKKMIAAILCVISAISFVVSGICVFIDHYWQSRVIFSAVAISTILFIAFWDGSLKKLHTQGAIAILINIMILSYTLFR